MKEMLKDMGTQSHPLSPKSPHFWWLICLLSGVILALAGFIITKRVIGSDRLMEYVSVCSVLLSITLSIFAIQYTYTSNNEIHQQFEKINSVADNIRYTSEGLIATSNYLKENLPQILEYLEFLKKNQQDMSAQIKNISNPSVKTAVNNYNVSNTKQEQPDRQNDQINKID